MVMTLAFAAASQWYLGRSRLGQPKAFLKTSPPLLVGRSSALFSSAASHPANVQVMQDRIVSLLKEKKDSSCFEVEMRKDYETKYGSSAFADAGGLGLSGFRELFARIPSIERINTNENGNMMLRLRRDEEVIEPTKTLADAQRKMASILRSSPHNVGELLYKYEQRYGVELNFNCLGFKKFKRFLETIPFVRFDRKGKVSLDGPMEVSSFQQSTMPDSKLESSPNGLQEAKEIPSPVSSNDSGFFEYATGKRHSSSAASTTSGDGPSSDTFSQSSGISGSNGDSADSNKSTVHRPVFLIADAEGAEHFEETALVGHSGEGQAPEEVYLNTHVPFCSVAVGVQGAGKSHTMGCLLESCLLQSNELSEQNILHLQARMTTMVLHYDQSPTSVCEAAGLLSPANPAGIHLGKDKAVVLVSPSYYRQRKAFYGNYCHVRPLLFQWDSLTADHIKRIMHVDQKDNQLYMASFMRLLRGYQRKGTMPTFYDFIKELDDTCQVRGQAGPLAQRIALLESIVAESEINQDIQSDSMDLASAIQAEKKLIIVDLTDPLLSKEEANSLFQVVTEKFRSIPVQGGKLLALDEAHKFMDGVKGDGLSEAIVNVARLMRHDGIRLAVSTQNPQALAPELLDLVSIAFLHHFHSKDWWQYLKHKLPLEDSWFTEHVLNLQPGKALVFANKSNFSSEEQASFLEVDIRKRLTADFGGTRTNSNEEDAESINNKKEQHPAGAKEEMEKEGEDGKFWA